MSVRASCPPSATRRVLVAIVATAALVVGACSQDQDPGLGQDGTDQQVDVDTSERPVSGTLGPCPEGGPDATTPAAGCLDPDGAVVRP